MNMLRRVSLLVLFTFILAFAQNGKTIEIGSFNIEWFPCKDDGQLMKKYDINLRRPPTGNATNIKALFSLLKELDVELFGLVEIVDPKLLQEAAEKYLGPQFKVLYAPSKSSQKVAFLYDSSVLRVVGQPEIYAEVTLDPDSWLRPAFRAYFKVIPNGFDFHAIITHLKAAPGGYKTRQKQWQVLAQILKDLPEQTRDADIVLMGDFNNVSRHQEQEFLPVMKKLNFFWATSELKDQGYFSNYWQPDYSVQRIEGSLIDQIFISDDARLEYVPGSMRVGGMCSQKKREFSADSIPEFYEEISDHCPVYGTFRADVDND